MADKDPVAFHDETAYRAAVVRVNEAIGHLPGTRIKSPSPIDGYGMRWYGAAREVGTVSGTMGFRAEVYSDHIRVRALPPEGLVVGAPFGAVGGPYRDGGYLQIAHLDGPALLEPARIGAFAEACAAALRAVVSEPETPAPCEEHDPEFGADFGPEVATVAGAIIRL